MFLPGHGKVNVLRVGQDLDLRQGYGNALEAGLMKAGLEGIAEPPTVVEGIFALFNLLLQLRMCGLPLQGGLVPQRHRVQSPQQLGPQGGHSGHHGCEHNQQETEIIGKNLAPQDGWGYFGVQLLVDVLLPLLSQKAFLFSCVFFRCAWSCVVSKVC